MKIIAHRGASRQHRENTIAAFHFAADQGADLIEMDIRYTRDQTFVIFHDETLERVDGLATPVDSLTYQQLCDRLKHADWPIPLRLDELDKVYQRKTPLLFHVKFTDCRQRLAEQLDDLHIPFNLGVEQASMAVVFVKHFGKNKILAFMPSLESLNTFIDAGVGIIRLWESWLDPAIVEACHQKQTEVWVMTENREGIGETDLPALNRIRAAGADGVLLNDICLVQNWQNQRE